MGKRGVVTLEFDSDPFPSTVDCPHCGGAVETTEPMRTIQRHVEGDERLHLRTTWDGRPSDAHTVAVVIRQQAVTRGHADVMQVARELTRDIGGLSRLTAAVYDDTADGATGWLYDVSDGEFSKVGEVDGGEGRYGKDVQWRLEDNHNITPLINP